MKKLLLGDSLINQFIQVLPITFLIDLIYIIFKIIYLKRKKININYYHEIFNLIFISYLVILFNLILVPVNFWSRIWNFVFYGVKQNPFSIMFEFSYNFVPIFYKIIMHEYTIGSWVKTMLIGNILMFIPLGIFLFVKKITIKKIFLYAILIPLIIELIQPIIGRSFDIDDLILNFLGIIIGYFITFILYKTKANKLTKNI